MNIGRRDSADTVADAVIAYFDHIDCDDSVLGALQCMHALNRSCVQYKFPVQLLAMYADKDTMPSRYVRIVGRVYNAAQMVHATDVYSRNLVLALNAALDSMEKACRDDDDDEVGNITRFYNLIAVKSQVMVTLESGTESRVAQEFWKWAANWFAAESGCDRRKDFKLGTWFLEGVRRHLKDPLLIAQTIKDWVQLSGMYHPVEASCYHDAMHAVLLAYPTCAMWDAVVRQVFLEDYSRRCLCNVMRFSHEWGRARSTDPDIRCVALRALPAKDAVEEFLDITEDQDMDADPSYLFGQCLQTWLRAAVATDADKDHVAQKLLGRFARISAPIVSKPMAALVPWLQRPLQMWGKIGKKCSAHVAEALEFGWPSHARRTWCACVLRSTLRSTLQSTFSSSTSTSRR